MANISSMLKSPDLETERMNQVCTIYVCIKYSKMIIIKYPDVNQVTFSPSLDSPNPSLSDEGQGVGIVCLENSLIICLYFTTNPRPA